MPRKPRLGEPRHSAQFIEDIQAKKAVIARLAERKLVPDTFRPIIIRYLTYMNPAHGNLCWVAHWTIAQETGKSKSTVRAYLKADEQVGAIVVVYRTVKAAQADLPALRGAIKLGPGQQDRVINGATFNPDWEGFAKGTNPLPAQQLEIIAQHRRKFTNVLVREPVQETTAVQEYYARGRLLGAGSGRNTTPVDGRHTTPVDGRQKTTFVVVGSKEPLPKEAVPVELEKPANGGCAEQSQQDRYQQLIRLCRGRVIVGRVLRLIRARIARGFAAAKPGSGGRIEYNPPPTPLIAGAK